MAIRVSLKGCKHGTQIGTSCGIKESSFLLKSFFLMGGTAMERSKGAEVIALIKAEGRIAVQFTVVQMGKDLCIVVCGGDRPHLGAAAVAQCHPSLANPSELSASVSVLTLLGHKEDKLAASVAERISRKIGANVAVLCGIHVDDISKTEIECVCRLVDDWCEEYLQMVQREVYL